MDHESSHGARRMTAEQRGVAAAILVAFVGVALGGPALMRLEARRRRLVRRVAGGAEELRDRSRRYAEIGRRRLRRLGGGTIRR